MDHIIDLKFEENSFAKVLWEKLTNEMKQE